MRTTALVVSLGAVLAGGCAAHRPMVTPSERLAVSRVVLFQNGLAYVERQGPVKAGSVELETRAEHLDDVLKSLTVVDRSGGQVASVRVLPSEEEDEAVTLRVGLAGEEDHDLSISYVAEMSGWRPTYRLIAGAEGGMRVQGMAVVDNHTGEGWEEISLVLSTDVPLSFRYALREPRIVERPELSSDGRLVQKVMPAARPRVGGAPTSDVQGAYALANVVQPEISMRAGARVHLEPTEASPEPEAAEAEPVTREVDPREALEGRESTMGVMVESPARFTLASGESGLVPFLDRDGQGQLVLLYKPAPGGGASHRRPYRAAFFENPLDAPLLTGPVAVYEQGRFLGDGVTGTIPAGTHAFVAYALDPAVRVSSAQSRASDDVRALRLAGGYLSVELHAVRRTTFSINSPEALDRPLYLFVEAQGGFDPRQLPDGTVTTPAGYYVPAPRGIREARVPVEQVRERTERVHIAAEPGHAFVPALLDLLEGQEGADVAGLRRIVDRLAELRHLEARCDEDLEVHRRALVERRGSLEALRDVPANGALRARIARGVAEGVARVDELTRQRVEASAEGVSLRAEWYELLRELVVEGRS